MIPLQNQPYLHDLFHAFHKSLFPQGVKNTVLISTIPTLWDEFSHEGHGMKHPSLRCSCMSKQHAR
jgi:hypothetical protein